MSKRILDDVIEHVQEYARFMPDAPNSPYYVRYPNHMTGTFFCAKDTHDLVLQIMENKHPRASVRGY